MNLQCAHCLEPTIAGEPHDCSKTIASLRIEVASLHTNCAALRGEVSRLREAVEALIKAYEGEVKWFTADNAAKKRISDAWQGLYIASRTGEG